MDSFHWCTNPDRILAGKKLGLEKAWRCVLESPEFQNLTKEEEEALKAELLGDREHTKKGTRATNNAAAADARFTIGMIAEEVCYSYNMNVIFAQL